MRVDHHFFFVAAQREGEFDLIFLSASSFRRARGRVKVNMRRYFFLL